MKAIDIRFLLMGIFFLLYGMVRKNIFIVIVGGAFLVYSFYSKKMEPTTKTDIPATLRTFFVLSFMLFFLFVS